jgi:coenzyme PQQ precursor peptide PqqA
MYKTQEQKKEWIKPAFTEVPIFFECTYYAAAERTPKHA